MGKLEEILKEYIFEVQNLHTNEMYEVKLESSDVSTAYWLFYFMHDADDVKGTITNHN